VWDTFIGRDDDMDVGGPAVDGMERPASKRAFRDDCFLDSMPLMSCQHDRVFGHEATCVVGKSGVWLACQAVIIDPAASVAGEPRAVGRPCEEDCQRFGNERGIRSVWHGGREYTYVQFCARDGEELPSPIKAPGASRGIASPNGQIPSLALRAFMRGV
jgi:hypothetical protein